VRFEKYLLSAAWLCVLLVGRDAFGAPLDRSVSSSHQFIVYGTTTPLRGAVAEVAEKTKASVLNVLRQRDGWKIPIVLNLQFPQANVPEIPPAALRFSQTGSGLKIQLDLTITADVDVTALRRQLLRVTLLEMIYRQAPDLPAGSYYVEPPDWLVEGLLAADPSQDRAAMSQAIEPLITANKVPSLEEFLGQHLSLLDSAGQMLYRACSLAFLQLLLNDSGGPARLAHYINNLSQESSDPVSDLKVQFPVLGGGADVDALWKTSVTGLRNFNYGLLTATDTERELGKLVGNWKGTQPIPGATNLLQLSNKKISRSQAIQLRQLKENLMLLGAQANPILRPVVLEYAQIAARVAEGRTKGVAPRLARISAQRERIQGRAGEIDDYMNWFEATKPETSSGEFGGYLRAAAQSDEERPRRHDPISVYLDVLEEQF
jgi:hypothetical protein